MTTKRKGHRAPFRRASEYEPLPPPADHIVPDEKAGNPNLRRGHTMAMELVEQIPTDICPDCASEIVYGAWVSLTHFLAAISWQGLKEDAAWHVDEETKEDVA